MLVKHFFAIHTCEEGVKALSGAIRTCEEGVKVLSGAIRKCGKGVKVLLGVIRTCEEGVKVLLGGWRKCAQPPALKVLGFWCWVLDEIPSQPRSGDMLVASATPA